MSKKKTLNESQIRRFMGLAGINNLADGYISRGAGVNLQEIGISEEEEEMAPMDEPMDELPAEDPMDEPEMEEPMEELPAEELSVSDVEAALADALQAMASELEGAIPGLELSVDSDEELPAEEPMEEPELEEPMGEPMEEPEMGMHMSEEVSNEVQVIDTEAIVKEVYRRVAQRLNKMVKDNK